MLLLIRCLCLSWEWMHKKIYINQSLNLGRVSGVEGWWQRIPLSAGRIELQPASLSFLYVHSESLPFYDENLAFLYVSRVFCTIRFPDGGGLVLRRRREDL